MKRIKSWVSVVLVLVMTCSFFLAGVATATAAEGDWTADWTGSGWTAGEEEGVPTLSAPNELYRLTYNGNINGMNTFEADIRIDSIGVDFGNVSMGLEASNGVMRYFSYTHGTKTVRVFNESDGLITSLELDKPLNVGTYHHWKVQWDGRYMLLHIDDELIMSYDYAADSMDLTSGATCWLSEWYHASTVRNMTVSNAKISQIPDQPEQVNTWDMSVWDWQGVCGKGVDAESNTEILSLNGELTALRYNGSLVGKNHIGGDFRIDQRYWEGPGNTGIALRSDQGTEYLFWYNQYSNTINLSRNNAGIASKVLAETIQVGQWFTLELVWNDTDIAVLVDGAQKIAYNYADQGDTFGADATVLLSEWGQPTSVKNLEAGVSNMTIYRNFSLSSIFGNNMMFQRRKPVKIFGQGGEVGDTVKVEFAGQVKTTTITDQAGWAVYLDPMEANTTGQTMTLTYTREGETTAADLIRINGIVIGELWLASGQSNMMYEIGWLRPADEGKNNLKPYDEIENLDKLRYYYVVAIYADEPATYGASTTSWTTPQQGNIEGYSATSLGFAAQLQLSLGEDVPVGIIQCALNGSYIEEWLDAETVEKTGSTHTQIQSRLYNGMVHNFRGMTIAGILWYQGEANAFANGLYAQQMKAYVELYRSLFEDADLPVVQFQLPQFNEQVIEKAWPIFRQTQWDLMQIDNVYSVTGIDLGNPFDIHPTDKWPFTGRAAGVALKYIYGVKEEDLHAGQKAYGLSPYISGAQWTEEGILLSFSDAETLVAGSDYIGGFEGFDGTQWIQMDAAVRGNKILLTGNHEEVTELRYLQRPFFSGNIFVYNEYGLPIAPFASVRRIENSTVELGEKVTVQFDSQADLKEFRTYASNGSKFTVADGMLHSGASVEMKAILKNSLASRNSDVSVDILPETANGRINGGLYFLGSSVGNAQDQIEAWNVQIERNPNSRDLVVSLHRFDQFNGWQRAYVSVCMYGYFDNAAVTEPVNLRVVVENGKMRTYLDGKLLWDNVDVGELSCGGVGIRSQSAAMKFDNFAYAIDTKRAVKGDLNGNGAVNSADARLVLQYVVGAIKLTEEERKLADVNNDGQVDSADARIILQTAVGLS